jgi:hypothetical protein
MNSLTSNPSAAQLYARQTIDQRVRDAEQRRFARSVRAERPDKPNPQPPNRVTPVPWWSFRFLRPAS